MTFTLLISLLVMTAMAGAATVLYFKERMAHKEFRDFHYRFLGNERQELTPEGVADAVRFNGYVPIMHEDNVEFRVGDDLYHIWTKDLPYLVVETTRSYDPDKLDMDLFRQTAVSITEEKHLVKLTLSLNGELRIQTQAYEPDRVNFRDFLKIYISNMEDADERLCERYCEIRKSQNLRKELEDFYLHPGDKTNKNRKYLS